jgi:hypothetical protein
MMNSKSNFNFNNNNNNARSIYYQNIKFTDLEIKYIATFLVKTGGIDWWINHEPSAKYSGIFLTT